MLDDRARRRTEMRDKLAELKNAALAELERRGYDVRGKRQSKLDRYLDDAPRSGNQEAKVTAFKWWTLGRG